MDGVSMIAPETLPPVKLWMQRDERLRFSLVCEAPLLVQLDAVDRIHVRRAPIEIPAVAVGIVEDVGIPWPRRKRVRRKGRLRAVRHRVRKRWEQSIVELEPPGGRRRRDEDRSRLERRLH